MATGKNLSNEIAVNIALLPQAQILEPTDIIPVNTQAGQEIITFENLNVVKTDLYGNATVTGDLTGNNSYINTVQSNSISAINFSSQGNAGINSTNTYFNYFTLNGGIVTSAVYLQQASPDYQDIITYLQTLTTYQSNFYSLYYDTAGNVILNSGTSNVLVDNITLPTGLTYANFSSQPWAGIYLTPYGSIVGLSAMPYLYVTGVQVGSMGGNTMQFTINCPVVYPFGLPIGYRLLKAY